MSVFDDETHYVPDVTNASAMNIGKVVVLQIVNKADNDGRIDLSSFKRHVGILESFSLDKNEFVFRLRGGEREFVNHERQRVDLHVLPERSVVPLTGSN